MAKRKNRPAPGPAGADPLAAYRSLLPPDEMERLEEALRRPLPAAIRVNPLKISEADARRAWPRWYGWHVEPVPFCPSGWQLPTYAVRPSSTIEFKLGFFYIQDAASMLPVELFDLEGLERPLLLDLAAAPGGKSTHLAARAWDSGLLIANDSSHGRLPALKGALLDWGALNSVVTNLPGEKFGRWFPDTFDAVLLDAPCSMENLRGTGKRVISARERQGLAQRQARLLASALQAVRPGGQVVYSTCTLAPEEDEAVLHSVLRQFGGAVQVDAVRPRGEAQPAPGLPYLGEHDFDPQVQHALRLWPHSLGTAGFFAARLTRLESADLPAEEPPRYTFEKHGFTLLSGAAGQRAFLDRLADQYGLDLEPVLERQGARLWKRNEAVYALPEAFVRQFAALPVETLGFLIAEETADGLVPSHEFVARFGLDFRRGRAIAPAEHTEAWMRGSDLPLPVEVLGAPASRVVAVEDTWGRLLGRGRLLPDRVKNMLPSRVKG